MALDDNPFAASDANPFRATDPWADSDDLELLKADRGQCFIGALVDGFLPLVLVVPAVGGAILVGSNLDADAMEGLFYLAYLGSMLPFSLLNWYLIVTRGQTLGKMAVGTRIVTEDGAPVDFVKGVILRNWVIAFINGLCGIASLIDALMIFGETKQCGHDMIAKTIVVNASSWNPYES
jgi:uncharacterized RDD family membrane protein YckC